MNNDEVVELSHDEKIIKKYLLLKEKIIEKYKKGCKILDTVKYVFASLFIIFTIIALVASNQSGNKMFWLILWIVIILTNIGIFMVTDYCKYLVKNLVIPYLEDDDQIEFKKFDLFSDDILGENEDEESEENME